MNNESIKSIGNGIIQGGEILAIMLLLTVVIFLIGNTLTYSFESDHQVDDSRRTSLLILLSICIILNVGSAIIASLGEDNKYQGITVGIIFTFVVLLIISISISRLMISDPIEFNNNFPLFGIIFAVVSGTFSAVFLFNTIKDITEYRQIKAYYLT